jgi:hypothetical protein
MTAAVDALLKVIVDIVATGPDALPRLAADLGLASLGPKWMLLYNDALSVKRLEQAVADLRLVADRALRIGKETHRRAEFIDFRDPEDMKRFTAKVEAMLANKDRQKERLFRQAVRRGLFRQDCDQYEEALFQHWIAQLEPLELAIVHQIEHQPRPADYNQAREWSPFRVYEQAALAILGGRQSLLNAMMSRLAGLGLMALFVDDENDGRGQYFIAQEVGFGFLCYLRSLEGDVASGDPDGNVATA